MPPAETILGEKLDLQRQSDFKITIYWLFLKAYICIRGFFRRWPLNSRTKKLKLKEIFPKTQGFFPRKLKKPANLGQISRKNSKFCLKIAILTEKIEKFPKTQGFSQNSSPKSVKNSRNRQFRKSHHAKKAH